jgi:hypothetical protein
MKLIINSILAVAAFLAVTGSLKAQSTIWATRNGNTTWFSNGTWATQNGNTTWYSNGAWATRNGNTTWYNIPSTQQPTHYSYGYRRY